MTNLGYLKIIIWIKGAKIEKNHKNSFDDVIMTSFHNSQELVNIQQPTKFQHDRIIT